jgi:RNA polymerase sigma factor for flagellar operon FliA
LNSRAVNREYGHPNLGVPLSDPDRSSLREQIVEKYTPLIKYIAHRLAMRLPPHISADDLFGVGAIGLLDALDKFDSTKKVQFRTYAEFRIKGAMLDELRSLDWVSRSVRQKAANIEKTFQALEKKKGRSVEDEEVAEEMGISLDDFHKMLNETQGVFLLDIESLRTKFSRVPEEDLFDLITDEKENNPLQMLSLEELKKVLAQAIEALPLKERTVIALYYYEELTLKEIGEVLNYTESRICQIHTKAILKLRSKLKYYLKDFRESKT